MRRSRYIDEQWLPIRGYEGLYEISDYGRVKSLNYRKQGAVKILQTRAPWGDYIKVGLRKDDKIRYYRVHRLVAIAFLPTPQEGKTQVEHINGDNKDNRKSNLRFVSPKEAMTKPQIRYKLSISHLNPSRAVRKRMSEGQKKRFARKQNLKEKR